MRVGTAYQYQIWTQNLDQTSSNVFQYQSELSSGKRISKPSDDPYGTATSLNLTSVNNALTQYSANLQVGQTTLKFSESAITNLNSLSQQMASLAVQAGTATASQDARNSMVTQVDQIQQQVLSLANTQGQNGEYIFGGQQTKNPPFTATASGTLTYNGDGNSRIVDAGPGQTMQISTPGKGTFDTFYAQLQTFKNDLSAGNIQALNTTDLQNFQNMNTQSAQTLSTIGVRLQDLTSLTNQNSQRGLELSSQISNITDANFADVATKYQSAQTVYQAALQLTASIQKLSILNYI